MCENFIYQEKNTVDSTNDYLARELYSGKIKKDKILVAREQTNGHGTNDRNFLSKKNLGIYFSFLHFYNNGDEIKFLTQKVAVAVYNTFFDIFNIELSMKWLNDLLYNEKKVCGILCKNCIKYNAVIIGIGIDLFCDNNLSNEYKNIIGYIFKNKKDLIKKLNDNNKISKCSCIYKNIYEGFKTLEIDDIIVDDAWLWDASEIIIYIVEQILKLIKINGIPKLYIEKNIIKDKNIYEDSIMECQWT